MYNMYRAKVDGLAGKTDFLQKKGLKMACFGGHYSGRVTLEGAGGQTGDLQSTFGAPLKSLGHNASNELCGSIGLKHLF